MGKTAVGVIALLIGLIGGFLAGGSLIGGTMAGAGAGAGLSTGICSTVQAAQELGYLTAEQVDEVLNRAADDLVGGTAARGEEIVGSAAECSEVMKNLQQSS